MSSRRLIPHAFLLALVLGCGGGDESLRETVLRSADLPGARTSELPALAAEVSRITDAGQTPKLLAATPPADDDNAAAILTAAMSDETRLRLFPRLADLLPDQRFEFDPSQLQQIRQAVRGMQFLRLAIEKADAASVCVFATENELGYFAGMRFLDDVAIATRLHLLTAAPAIAEGQIALACDELDAALRWIDRLAKVARLEARLLASQLRGEALSVVEALADNPAMQRADLERLYALLRRSLDAWPDDAAPLMGDRAVTMHTYELIRAGLFDQVVTMEEKESLKSRGLLESMRSMPPSQIDSDELAYLQAMRALISGAQAPYYRRANEIAAALGPFDSERASAAEAPLAARLFLPGLPRAMQEMARDRAICEAWALALAAVGEIDLPPYKQNPLTGTDYEIDRHTGALYVRTGDPELRDPYARALP